MLVLLGKVVGFTAGDKPPGIGLEKSRNCPTS